MFRAVATLGLVLGAIWMFWEGDQFSRNYYELPAWLVDIPPWVVGVVLLVSAAVAAVIPEETVASVLEFFLSEEDGSRERGSIPCAKCGEMPPKHAKECDNNPRRYYE